MIAQKRRHQRRIGLLSALLRLETARALRSPAFAPAWSGQALSRIGDVLFEIALAWWVLERTGSAALMATLLAVTFVPHLLLLLLGGVAGDRFNRITIMLVSDLLRAGVMGGVAVLAWFDLLQIWHLLMLNLIMGGVDAFFQPAYTAAVPDLVPDDDLPSANALTSLSIQTGRIAGPALGAGMVALGGTALAFTLNSLSFAIAAVLLLPLVRRRQSPTSPVTTSALLPAPGLLADLRMGIATVVTTPWLWITILLFALTNVTLAGPYSVALPFLVRDHWQADVGTLGLLYALFSVGYVLGGLWLGRRRRLRRRGRLVYGGIALAGLMLLLFGLPVPVLLPALGAVVNGAMLEVSQMAWTTAVQQYVPREQLGRVAGMDALGSFALIPVGYAFTGWATEVLGAPTVFVLGGGMTTLVALLLFAGCPAVRRLD